MKLELLEFIAENENWEEVLSEKPYSITIKRKNGYVLFSYSQISSDFSLRIVQECRGIIIKESTLKPVCVPFFKFFNVQEGHAANIDWNTARAQEKIDGSIIKVWFDDETWHISTNGTIDARDAELQENVLLTTEYPYANYEELFLSVFHQSIFFEVLNIQNTYMFEVVSPFNRVVVPYDDVKIYHIGTRNNITLEELNEDIGVEKPKEYRLRSVDECLELVSLMPFSQEGYVVVDENWNRVKIKSPAYVAAHHLKNNGIITISRIVDMIRVNGQDDFCSVYPEYQDAVDKVLNGVFRFLDIVTGEWDMLNEQSFESRKDLAIVVNKTYCPSTLYSMYDKKVSSIQEWLFNQNNERLLKLIGVE